MQSSRRRISLGPREVVLPRLPSRGELRDAWLTPQRLAEVAGFLLVLGVALAVRRYRLGTVPEVIVGDEADNIHSAYKVIEGTAGGFFGFDWKPAPIASLYPLAWCIRIFGDSVSDFRMFPLILSMLTLIVFYALARESMRAPAALGAMLLLATNLWFLHFSRTAWENMNSALFSVGACWAVTRAVKTSSYWWWFVTGLFTTAGLYGYFSGRFIFIAVGVAVALAIALRQAEWKRAAMGLGLAAVVTVVLFAPMAKRIADDWDYFNRRTENASVFSTKEPYEGDTDGWVIAAKNAGRNFRGFILQDEDEMGRGLWSRYTPARTPPLDLVTRCLFWVGVAIAAVRWRRTLLWWPFIIPIAVAEVFSRGTPDLARGLIFAPFFFLFAGMTFDEMYRRARGWLPQGAVIVAIGVVVALVAYDNVRDYFDWQDDPAVQTQRFPGVDTCEFSLWRDMAMQAASRAMNVNGETFELEARRLGCSEVRPQFD